MLIFVVSLSLLCVLGTAAIFYDQNRVFLISQARYDHDAIVQSSANEIKNYIEGYRVTLDLVADLLGVVNVDEWTREILIRVIGRRIQNFRDLCVVNPQGEELVSSMPRMTPRSFSDNPTVIEALGGVTSYSNVHFDKFNIPTMFMAAPIKRRGKIIGAVWAHFDLEKVWNVLEEIRPSDESVAYLVDDLGKPLPLSSGSFDPYSARHQQFKFDDEALRISSHSWVMKSNGSRYLASTSEIQGTKWRLVLLRSLDDIYAHLRESFLTALFVVFLIVILACLSSIIFVRKFVRPIEKLRDGAKRIAQGDLGYRVEELPSDEIGELGVAFNQMADDLQMHMKGVIRAIAQDARQRNLSLLGATVSKVNHQLKNFLNAMTFAVSNIKMTATNKEALRSIEIMEQNLYEMAEFTRGQLESVKTHEIKAVECDLIENLKKLAHTYELSGISTGISCFPEKDGDFRIQCYWPYLSQAFSSILENSMDALRGEGRVEIIVTEFSSIVQVQIKDHGPGLDPEGLERIFEPFYTTKEKGYGMGLAVANNMIQAHSGILRASNAPEGGACFTIELPKRMSKGISVHALGGSS